MPKQERSERTLERLVVSAAERFAAEGFVRATLADVSRSAGVTKGALFFHFQSKDELADAVQARGQDILESALEELRGLKPVFVQVVVDVTHELNHLLRSDPFVRASVRITRERAPGTATPLDFYPLWLGRLWQLLEDARVNGELGRSVTDDTARTLVTAAVSGVETLVWMGVPHPETTRWLSSLWDLVLPLLLPHEPEVDVRTTAPRALDH
ncbi:TetR/AcrR family transcriptional regulator [Streptomyces triticagri]|uniref:TetR/AcrR family transcriptional regulator n=1 Tax=Streptomyces triticagri TaxID=2293568 RepID=A0A372M8J7_9ACTN|nr:ScbR family autoregulator-binding transcription factor [Streptomyces triticagri]RFU86763.1 TetR/AcrR family transcriptional regulator [Streptomyces triticagri]